MKFIELAVKTHSIIHGYDDNNELIIELVNEKEFVNKFIAIRRIESVSEEYLLIKLSCNRVAYWEYNEDFEVVKLKLESF